jgi:hypothetical protein
MLTGIASPAQKNFPRPEAGEKEELRLRHFFASCISRIVSASTTDLLLRWTKRPMLSARSGNCPLITWRRRPSMRGMVDAALFAWMVVTLPGCPVFQASSSSTATSPERISPKMIRWGGQRRAVWMAETAWSLRMMEAEKTPFIVDVKKTKKHNGKKLKHGKKSGWIEKRVYIDKTLKYRKSGKTCGVLDKDGKSLKDTLVHGFLRLQHFGKGLSESKWIYIENAVINTTVFPSQRIF